MATRAAIIYLDPAQLEAISTYNHYDGYPENLGVALEKHYNDDFKANRIASEGYISYVDPETGNIDAKNQDNPDRLSITDDPEQTAMDLAELISSYGADYAYIWSAAKTEWHTIKNYGTRSTFEKLEQMMPELFGMSNFEDEDDVMEGDFVTEWKKYLNENTVEKVMSQAFFKLQDEPKEMVDAYKKSLANDIRLNGKETYEDYSVEDFIEDYENYIADKMDM